VSRLKLTTYFGERDRVHDAFLADALLDIYERHALEISVLLRGSEGFGLKRHLHTDRLLTLSEDLPVVAVAVDQADRIEAVIPEVEALAPGLITVEGVPGEPPGTARLTLYTGRAEAPGLATTLPNATVLLGVDGTRHGVRHRARFRSANADVPAMVIAVGPADELAAIEHPLSTLERVTICEPGAPPPPVPDGMAQKITIYSETPELVPRLRRAGAAGATALRGYGDRFWSLRRHVPTVTVVVDEPSRVARWWPAVEGGLVTSELVRRATAVPPGT
jgi:PII-like signaling protein